MNNHLLSCISPPHELNYYDYCVLTVNISPYYVGDDSFYKIRPEASGFCRKYDTSNAYTSSGITHMDFLHVDNYIIPSTFIFYGVEFKIKVGESVFNEFVPEKPYPKHYYQQEL